ncbi:homeobox-domain-containing protein [Heliocybe sulcata]|uniref:Homeobox-domain-containing protein n=1 Tax=Heliocybe sulcata TaxID=5364 RepID=A0A5C3N1U7_9AGAM|nr:homeobox-domain-containing protein [Heliocybe sulcata]
MSHSRSTTPTPNPSTSIPTEATSTRPSFDLLASSREAHEIDPAPTARQTRDSSPPPPKSPVAPANTPSQSTSGIRGEKRPRRDSDEGRTRMSSPSGSSSGSHADMADTELEGVGDERSERSPAPPAKKKRTRTLTTPHQSAVLHALLAQSRFPTTAMREEVGRQIGLSARKVQVWFQNQRQKAKRPKSQGAQPISMPPQYGPFPNAPGTAPAPVGSFVTFGPSAPSPEALSPSETAYSSVSSAGSERAFYAAEQSLMGTGGHLSGPGIPGATFTPSLSPTRGHEASARRRGPSRLSQTFDHAPPFHPPTADLPGGVTPRYPAADITRAPVREHPYTIDPTLTLPPLAFDRPHTHGSLGGAGVLPGSPHSERLPSSAPSTVTSFVFDRPTLVAHDSPFAHHLPEPRPSLSVIPPPFALQPRPQWDPDTFSPLSRPGTSSMAPMSRPGSSYYAPESRVSPRDLLPAQSFNVGTQSPPAFGQEASSNGESTPQPTPRLARFDPVRESAVSYRSPQADPTTPPRTPEHEPSGEPSAE